MHENFLMPCVIKVGFLITPIISEEHIITHF